MSPDRQNAYRWGAALLGAVLVLVPATALAQEEPSAQETALARSLFRQGMAAVELRDFETAADRLGRALALRDSPVIRTNLALALIELGRLVEASEHLRTVIRANEEGSEAHSVAERRLAEIEPRIGRLQIVVGGPRDGVHLLVDGAPMPEETIGVPAPADPGTHRISLVRLEREIASEQVTVRSGEVTAAALTAPPPTPEELAQMRGGDGSVPAVRDEGGIEEEPWFWILVGVLAAGAIVGAVTAVVITEENAQSRGSSGAIFRALVEWP